MFVDKFAKDEKYHQVRDHCHYTSEYTGTANNIRNLKYSIPKKVSVVFHNGSNCDCHFIIKKLVEKFER